MASLRTLFLTACLPVAAALSPALARADELVPTAELPKVLSLALETVYARQRADAEKNGVTLVADAALRELTGVTVFDRPVRLLTPAEAKEQQLAYFVQVTLSSPAPGQVVVQYSHPAPAYFGALTLTQEGGGWTVSQNKSYHSSSGARGFYGKMYEGVKCKDGSEMALRWNSYIEYFKAVRSGQASSKPADPSPTCPGPEFPEVAAYQQMQKLLQPKTP